MITRQIYPNNVVFWSNQLMLLGALPADQAVGDEEAAAPLDEEGAAAPPDADGGDDGN